MYEVRVEQKAEKQLDKITKGNPMAARQIRDFVYVLLPTTQNPLSMHNIKKMQGKENTYRWRVGNYRIIGEVYSDILLIKIIKIASRQDAY
ncbi:type II toxin-antitoxin system RelE/ParE family toxin [Helicobacter saguini]|uniref:Type II toxin-antitoxin system RelE/ParE family toxin n=1 Tax=Helicobacter saguini TaxID=1548018 RepID=A0A347VSH2_9HELI|nr:type II toxin-antitoxin system RelE/ParE family toxin [Helicobacter saguini]MWV62508.1 type II toxin-antitoxin system RelE/ParE family toxin [Helicobacter saguini]MWV66819.1 type II toxin-antitoxin system RelE/ParE family toxin [Helicobacter saguini]MWV69169.1 type II toxin-antitoxin system RelE/ParE family toxin [Helicobacter saguini]MWV71276.1 type II toxin-antitoxin system RelE/ParE family toxin [Helicobacter saguini]TLD94209.1 type II toxin-antitoxin system RelE/ParE family toxin [Helic